MNLRSEYRKFQKRRRRHMRRLFERTEQEGLLHHQQNPVRVYSEDECQRPRVLNSLSFVRKALASQAIKANMEIIELGCGAGDICGPLAEEMVPKGWKVIGVDCNAACLGEARLRYPHLQTSLSAIGLRLLNEYEMVIMCEVLEHLDSPHEVAKNALQHAWRSVVSHPLDEPMGSSLSGGDHSWSFSIADHKAFFESGGHIVDETSIFAMGSYKIVVSRGHRKEGADA